MVIGYLKKDRREKFVNKPRGGTRAWFVNAWRIVDAQGVDLIQPWDDTRQAAQATAAQCGITLAGNYPPPRPTYYDCGICGHLHPIEWNADCRDDANRYTLDQLDAQHGADGWDEVPMPE